jgi:tetratricopeptide (TPR) repeat protein
VAIQGPLRELGVHDVFQLLDLGRKTGHLRVVSELRQNEGAIWFHEAAVVAATIRSNPHLLGQQLLRAGKVRNEDLTRAEAIKAAGDKRRIGEILVAMGAITAKELRAQVRAQIEEVVFTMLGWSEGHFIFEETAPDRIPTEADVRISVEALLLEAARRIDEWSRIRGKVPHLGVVPRIVPAQQEEPGSLVLNPFEWRVLAACDAERDVQAIATTLGEPEFDVARAVFGLTTAGVVLVRDPVQESAAAAPREDAGALLAEGERLLRARNYDAARSIARSVTARFPEDVRGHLLAGRTLLAERRFEEAQPPLREAVRLDPASPRGLRLLSWALLGSGRLDEAVHGFEAWLALPALGAEEERKVSAVGAAIPAARQLAALLRGSHD